MTVYVTKAYDLRQFLSFVQETVCKVNISHHLQYLEFLYKIKKLHDPELTTLSLLNKSIIVEYFTAAVWPCLHPTTSPNTPQA